MALSTKKIANAGIENNIAGQIILDRYPTLFPDVDTPAKFSSSINKVLADWKEELLSDKYAPKSLPWHVGAAQIGMELVESEKDRLIRSVTQRRKNALQGWIDYLATGGYTPEQQFLVLKTVPLFMVERDGEELKARKLSLNSEEVPTPPRPDVVGRVVASLGENPDANLAVSYFTYERESMGVSLDKAEVNDDPEDLEWIMFPSKSNDPENFEENVNRLIALAKTSSDFGNTPWCTVYMANDQLGNGNFHVGIDKSGRARVAIRMEDNDIKGGQIAEIRGVLQGQNLEGKFGEQVTQYVQKYEMQGGYHFVRSALMISEVENFEAGKFDKNELLRRFMEINQNDAKIDFNDEDSVGQLLESYITRRVPGYAAKNYVTRDGKLLGFLKERYLADKPQKLPMVYWDNRKPYWEENFANAVRCIAVKEETIQDPVLRKHVAKHCVTIRDAQIIRLFEKAEKTNDKDLLKSCEQLFKVKNKNEQGEKVFEYLIQSKNENLKAIAMRNNSAWTSDQFADFALDKNNSTKLRLIAMRKADFTSILPDALVDANEKIKNEAVKIAISKEDYRMDFRVKMYLDVCPDFMQRAESMKLSEKQLETFLDFYDVSDKYIVNLINKSDMWNSKLADYLFDDPRKTRSEAVFNAAIDKGGSFISAAALYKNPPKSYVDWKLQNLDLEDCDSYHNLHRVLKSDAVTSEQLEEVGRKLLDMQEKMKKGTFHDNYTLSRIVCRESLNVIFDSPKTPQSLKEDIFEKNYAFKTFFEEAAKCLSEERIQKIGNIYLQNKIYRHDAEEFRRLISGDQVSNHTLEGFYEGIKEDLPFQKEHQFYYSRGIIKAISHICSHQNCSEELKRSIIKETFQDGIVPKNIIGRSYWENFENLPVDIQIKNLHEFGYRFLDATKSEEVMLYALDHADELKENIDEHLNHASVETLIAENHNITDNVLFKLAEKIKQRDKTENQFIHRNLRGKQSATTQGFDAIVDAYLNKSDSYSYYEGLLQIDPDNLSKESFLKIVEDSKKTGCYIFDEHAKECAPHVSKIDDIELLSSIPKDCGGLLKFELAKNPSTPPKRLASMLLDENPNENTILNPSTPKAALVEFAAKPDLRGFLDRDGINAISSRAAQSPEILSALCANEKAPLEAKYKGLRGAEEKVVRKVLADGKVKPDATFWRLVNPEHAPKIKSDYENFRAAQVRELVKEVTAPKPQPVAPSRPLTQLKFSFG